MPPIPATLFLTGVFALMLVVLSMAVSLRRRDLRLAMGDGGDETLKRRIRAHGNFIESAPMMVLIVLGLEITHAVPGLFVWIFVAAFVLARALHALSSSARPPAMLIQHAAMVIGGILLIVQAFNILTLT
jgi:uncharacterized membrane protein YecN with MAPEG domain